MVCMMLMPGNKARTYQHIQLADSLIELVPCDHNLINFFALIITSVLSFFLQGLTVVPSEKKRKFNLSVWRMEVN